jgi:hypothetical protein
MLCQAGGQARTDPYPFAPGAGAGGPALAGAAAAAALADPNGMPPNNGMF